jgi:hypothetical protein
MSGAIKILFFPVVLYAALVYCAYEIVFWVMVDSPRRRAEAWENPIQGVARFMRDLCQSSS